MLLSGCGSVQYFYQAGRGQLSLINRARPIDEVVRDEKVRPRTRELLAQVSTIKKFGEENGLKPTPNYREYVQLDRPAVVYVVSASESLRFEAKTWSFPIVGSFPYLGWFDLGDAKKFAETLKADGKGKGEDWDVDVRGARAYSTLGWFRDAVLSSMIPDGDEALGELANVILHESVHATLYVNGQSYFDESIANFVADRLTPLFLRSQKGESSPELVSYLHSEEQGVENEKVLHEAYLKLDGLYRSNDSVEVKLAEKARILGELKQRLQWKREINNATLIQYKTYNTGQEQFVGLFEACGKDVRRFMKALSGLRPSSFSSPQQEDLAPVLGPIARAGCPAA